MKGTLVAVPLGLTLALALGAPAGAADAIVMLDEFDVRSAIILNCHPSQTESDRAFLAKGDALRRAALEQIRTELDAADPAHRPDNLKQATDTVQRRRDARNFDIQEQVRNYGCAWLDPSRSEQLGFESGRPEPDSPINRR